MLDIETGEASFEEDEAADEEEEEEFGGDGMTIIVGRSLLRTEGKVGKPQVSVGRRTSALTDNGSSLNVIAFVQWVDNGYQRSLMTSDY